MRTKYDVFLHINEMCDIHNVSLRSIAVINYVWHSLEDEYGYIINKEDFEDMYIQCLAYEDYAGATTQVMVLRNMIISKHNLDEV